MKTYFETNQNNFINRVSCDLVTDVGFYYIGFGGIIQSRGRYELLVRGSFSGLAILGAGTDYPLVVTTKTGRDCCFLEIRGCKMVRVIYKLSPYMLQIIWLTVGQSSAYHSPASAPQPWHTQISRMSRLTQKRR